MSSSDLTFEGASRRSPYRIRGGITNWFALAAIVAVFAVGWVAVGAARDVPVVDDWVYGWSVEHLLATGRLSVLEYSSVYPVLQIVWGALFAVIGGFSFVTLRASTVCLAIAGCYALYLTMREMEYSPTVALLVALSLALHPVFFALSFSFMTDVPFLSVSNVAVFYFVSAAHRDRVSRLWVGSAFAVAAFLIRPLAVVLPFAAIAVVPWRAGFRRVCRWVVPLTVAIVAMAFLWVVLNRAVGPLDVATSRLQNLRGWLLIPLRTYAEWNVRVAFETAFPLAPLVFAVASRRIWMWTAAVAAGMAIVLALTMHEIPTPLPHWQTWSLEEFAARTMVSCQLSPPAWALRLTPFLRVAGLVVVSAFVVAGMFELHRIARTWHVGRPDAGVVPIAVGILHWMMINLLWFYNDRYYIVLAPTLAYLVTRTSRIRPAIAAGMLALWAVIDVTGMRDLLAINDAIARATRGLEQTGVRPWEIDAGYVSNGWRLYAHPENLRPGSNRRFEVPFVTTDVDSPYRIANCPMTGYEVMRVDHLPQATWQVTDRIYVLRRESRR